MEYSTVESGPIPVVGISIRTSNQTPEQIGELWRQFLEEEIMNQIPNRASKDIYAVYHSYDKDHTGPYVLTIGCEVTEAGELGMGLTSVTIPQATYAVVEAEGEQPQALIQAWKDIWAAGLPRAFTTDFEMHGQWDPNVVQIYVALRRNDAT